MTDILVRATSEGDVPLTEEELNQLEQDAITFASTLKFRIISAIKSIRDTRKAKGYKVVINGVDKWFHSDIDSKQQQQTLKMLGAYINSLNQSWKTMDGTFVLLTDTIVTQMFMAAITNEIAHFTKAETLIAQVNASNNPISIDINSGWPVVYGE